MKEILIVKVLRHTSRPDAPFKTVFEREVNLDSSLVVPYIELKNSLRFMFGNTCIIEFSSHLI